MSARASASSATSTTGATGPNVSSRAISMSGRTASRTVGSQKSCVGKPVARRPPQTTRAPAATASATCSSVLAATPSLFSGPMVVAASKESPRRTRSRTAASSRSTYLGPDAPLHQDPLAGGAALPCAEVGGLQRRRHGRVEVGVVEHDERAVAAQLQDLGLAGAHAPPPLDRWRRSR